MNVTVMNSIGRYIQHRRNSLGLSQIDLASAITSHGFKVARSTLAKWEVEESMPPIGDPQFVKALAQILEVTEADILAIAGFNLDLEGDNGELPEWFKKSYDAASPEKRKMIQKIWKSLLEEEDSGSDK